MSRSRTGAAPALRGRRRRRGGIGRAGGLDRLGLAGLRPALPRVGGIEAGGAGAERGLIAEVRQLAEARGRGVSCLARTAEARRILRIAVEHRAQQAGIGSADCAGCIPDVRGVRNVAGVLRARHRAHEHEHRGQRAGQERSGRKRYREKRFATTRHLQSPAHDLCALSALPRRTDNRSRNQGVEQMPRRTAGKRPDAAARSLSLWLTKLKRIWLTAG